MEPRISERDGRAAGAGLPAGVCPSPGAGYLGQNRAESRAAARPAAIVVAGAGLILLVTLLLAFLV